VFTTFDLANAGRFQQAASEPVGEPAQERIDVFASRLEAKDVRIIVVQLTGTRLVTVLGKSKDVVFIPDLFPNHATNRTHPPANLTQKLGAEVLTGVGHSSSSSRLRSYRRGRSLSQ